MKNLSLSRMILSMLLLGSTGFLVASEADKLPEQLRAMRNKAAAIAENAKKEAELGNKEQAERLKKESIKMQEAAEQMALKARERGEVGERPIIDKEKRQPKELLPPVPKLKEAKAPERERVEVREKISGVSRELQSQPARHEGLPPELRAHAEKLEAASRRIHHLKVAAENLKMAEAHDLAHDIMQKAESMEREVHEGKKRLDAEIQNIHRREHGPEHAPEIVQALKKEIEHLRAEVKELRHNLEKR
jgi:hypothetical protein